MTLPDSGLPTSVESIHNDVITAYNSLNAVMCRLANFLPNSSTGVATIQTRLDAAAKAGVPDEKLAEMPASFTTGFKEYVTAYWQLMQSLVAQARIRKFARVAQKQIAAAAGLETWHDDEWAQFLNEVNSSNILKLPWLDEVIVEMNPIILVAQKNEHRNLPDSGMLLWAPYETLATARTLLQELVAQSDACANYCAKLGIKYIQNLKIQLLLETQEPVIIAGDHKDERWVFWATHAFIRKYNSGGDINYYASKYSGAPFATTSANWWASTFYWYKLNEEGKPASRPYSLYGLVRMLYPYGATNNVIGCVADCEVSHLGSNDSIAENDLFIGCVAVRDQDGSNATKFYYMTHATTNGFLLTIFKYSLGHNTTYTFQKNMGNSQTLDYSEVSHDKEWVLEYFSTTVLEITNYSYEYRWFRNLMRGTERTGVPVMQKKAAKVETPAVAPKAQQQVQTTDSDNLEKLDESKKKRK